MREPFFTLAPLDRIWGVGAMQGSLMGNSGEYILDTCEQKVYRF